MGPAVVVLSALMASPVCKSELPGNIYANALQPVVLQLAQQSETFHQQCLRLAGMPRVRIQLFLTKEIGSFARARATISHFTTGAIRAEVTFSFSQDFSELVPHEFEHILEQAEGVDLRAEARCSRAWRLEDGAYETRRAVSAGLRARQEVEALAAEPLHRDSRQSPARRDPFE